MRSLRAVRIGVTTLTSLLLIYVVQTSIQYPSTVETVMGWIRATPHSRTDRHSTKSFAENHNPKAARKWLIFSYLLLDKPVKSRNQHRIFNCFNFISLDWKRLMFMYIQNYLSEQLVRTKPFFYPSWQKHKIDSNSLSFTHLLMHWSEQNFHK